MSPSPAPSTAKTHSTGPRTPAGKSASSQNALRHGLASGTILIPGEDPAVWHSLLADLIEEWGPTSSTEQLLVEDLAKHHWLKDRAMRLQSEALALAPAGQLPPNFALLLRYQTTNERAFTSALRTLESLQKNRREFVSQAEAKEAEAEFARVMAKIHSPLPPLDFEKCVAKQQAAGAPLPPLRAPGPLFARPPARK